MRIVGKRYARMDGLTAMSMDPKLRGEIENLRRLGDFLEAVRSRMEDFGIALESVRPSQKAIRLQGSYALLAQTDRVLCPNLIQNLLE